jgi:hypothetical protein
MSNARMIVSTATAINHDHAGVVRSVDPAIQRRLAAGYESKPTSGASYDHSTGAS